MATFLDMEAGEDRYRLPEDVSDEDDLSGSESDSVGPAAGGYLSDELPLVTKRHHGTKRVLNLPSDSDADENASQQRLVKKSSSASSKRPKYASSRILLSAGERPLQLSSKGNARLDKGSSGSSKQQTSANSGLEPISRSSEQQRSVSNTSSELSETGQGKEQSESSTATVSVSADLLVKLTESLKKTERRLKLIEDKLADSDNATRRPSSGKSTPSRKKEVPIEVRVSLQYI